MTNGRARLFHSFRPVSERERDEYTTETLMSDVEEWIKDPNKFDLPRVDDKSPVDIVKSKEYPLDETITGIKNLVSGEFVAEDRTHSLGSIHYVRHPCLLHLSYLSVEPEQRGKGYSIYLMRNLINMQDKLCVPIVLEIAPFGLFGSEVPIKSWRQQFQMLKRFYSSFGFKPTEDEDILIRYPVCESEMAEERFKEECAELDIEEWAELLSSGW